MNDSCRVLLDLIRYVVRRYSVACLLAKLDAGYGLGDLARHKDLAATRRLVVEENAVACIHVICLPATQDKESLPQVPCLDVNRCSEQESC